MTYRAPNRPRHADRVGGPAAIPPPSSWRCRSPTLSPGRPARESRSEPPPLNSNYPTPVYIPQAEYAQMLRDQKAAEKAAVAAAAELRRLAELEELDELAAKEEFSDWTS